MFEIIHKLLDNPEFKAKVKYRIRTYQTHEKIVSEGKTHNHMYLIRKGTAKVIVHGDKKDIQTLSPGIADLGPNDVFGEFSLFDDLPASADVIATAECELIEIDNASFRDYLETDTVVGHQIFLEMLKLLIKRLRHADKTIITLYAWGIKAHQIDKHLLDKELE